MNQTKLILNRNSLFLAYTLGKLELSLMEQGTPFGFLLSFLNNVVMLLMFHALFVSTFLVGVKYTWIYLLLGIIQWNLYVNVSMAGFSCFIYRQKIVMGYAFPREILVFARVGAVYLPYLCELVLVLLLACAFKIYPTEKYLLLPFFLTLQYFFCCGLCFLFSLLGVLHKNIIPFWNIMFRLLSFATPIFYVPITFASPLVNRLYSFNPFSNYMIWIRDITAVNGFPMLRPPVFTILGTFFFFAASYGIFQWGKARIGDCL